MVNDEFCTRVAEEMPRLRRYGLCLARDGDWANDLVQECVVRAIDNAEKFQPGTNLRSWLMTILHNIYVNEVKKRRPSLTADGSVDRGLPVEGNQESRHRMRDVQRAMRKLSSQHREIIRFICIDEMECREVGRQLGVSEGTVRSRLCRARDQLRRLVEPDAIPYEDGMASNLDDAPASRQQTAPAACSSQSGIRNSAGMRNSASRGA